MSFKILVFSSGTTQKGRGTRQDKPPVHTTKNGTSQLSSFSAREQCNDDDVMDCLVSFYSDMP